ncbi:calmodulin-regulated spectrin-associated protein 3 isoform X3 [Dipodomys spectabilis]|uniref:calmodulin-regulated spectrin-associated protein 3 isoform X3 n=1 Tax=Dipodomys spectabilis TaxID=105255 RepID=UPI001C545557|nr:calmodulin-regulated spectrin-associated protein 3 isoform X3 [Dipodomys spectabilis]
MVEAAPAGPGPLRRTFLVPEIKSLDQYDFSRAKAAASLAWVLRAAFGGAEHVPPELWEPFYTDQYAQEHVKPPVTRLLLSAELYCRAWRQALPQLETPPSPSALLALLARRGTVPALPERPVREADLRHQPILMGAHLAVIDALMVAFSFEWTKTLPSPLALTSLEHKLLFWVDTTIRRLQEKTEQDAAQRASPAAPTDGAAPAQPSIRYRKDRAVARRAPCFPHVTTLQDLASGAALAATIHCYCPQLLRLEEVCLKDPMSVADSLYNLQLVQDFCASRLPRGCPLSLEDLLYVPPPLKVNLVVLLAEMFMCFEVLKPDFVQAKDLPDGHATSPKGTEASPSQNNSGSSSPVFNFRHPLLSPGGPQSPLRGSTGSLKSSPSMSHMEALGKAWNRQLSRPLSQAVSFSTPFGLDSDVDVVMGDPVLLRSVSSDSLGPPRPVPARTPAQQTPEPGDLPTIEEALQIIHSAEPRLLPDGAADGSFYLHSPEGPSKPQLASSYPPDRSLKTLSDGPPKAPVYVSHPATPSKPSPSPAGDLTKPPAPCEGSPKAVASSPAATNSEVKMTSFAERKKQLVKAEAEAGVGSPTSMPAAPDVLSSEMSELGARLEEKRRAIEAQKRRIEAIFAKHRQRLGKSAFLQVQPREAGGEAEAEAEAEAQSGSVPGGERPAGEGQGEPTTRPKAVTFSPDLGLVPPEGLGDYNRAVSKLSAALSSLQRDMQRLTDQQQRLLAPPEAPGPAPPPAAWVIPGPPTGPKAASPSPARRAPATRRSPGPGPSPTPRSPKHARPAELRLAPLTRVLTPPHDVDSLPHLRKFSPSQVPVQTRSSILLAEGTPPEEPARPGLIEIPLGSLGEPPADEEGDGSPPGAEDSLEEEASSEGEPRAGLGFFYKDEDKPEDEMAQKRASLLERQQRRVEEARRRKQWQEAEKEQRREEAARLAQEEAPGPSPAAPTVAPATTLAPAARAPAEDEVGPRRGDFTRLEYERRAQLKLMDDLDKVLRPRATGTGGQGRGGRRAPRPRSGCCDDSALARSPARGLLGSRLSKIYSQSTLSLSTVANETPNNLGVKRPSRAPSPSGLMSPSRLPGNRDRDWENGSNASSPASVPEYTGPKLYKEPSAKSNKFIIHNALSHCCLAGKVNEPQKNRILEEIEKSKANHFLILFRDSSCQFRALYTLSGETEELSRLAGYGPRTVTPAMVEGIYKYNSDRKRFTQIPAKTMSMSVDAFTIQGHLWQSKKPTTPKKGGGTPK